MDILYTVKSITGALRRWVEANPELTGTLMKVAAVVAAVTVGLGTLAVALAAVLGPLAVIRLGFSVLGIKVTFRYGSDNSNQQRVVCGWLSTTGTAATRSLLHRATPQRVTALRRCRLCFHPQHH